MLGAGEEAGDDAALAFPERRFAIALEEVGDRAARGLFDLVVGIMKGQVQG